MNDTAKRLLEAGETAAIIAMPSEYVLRALDLPSYSNRIWSGGTPPEYLPPHPTFVPLPNDYPREAPVPVPGAPFLFRFAGVIVAHPDDERWLRDTIKDEKAKRIGEGEEYAATVVRAAPAYFRREGPFTLQELVRHLTGDKYSDNHIHAATTKALTAAGWRNKTIGNKRAWYLPHPR